MEFGRGRLTSASNRIKIIEVIDKAILSGARQFMACEEIGITERTLQRWRLEGIFTKDKRPDAIRPTPKNKLSEEEELAIINVMNKEEYHNLPPSQVVPNLADEGNYIASESTFYRVLNKQHQNNHRGQSKPPVTLYDNTSSHWT